MVIRTIVQQRIPQVPQAPLPELSEFLAPFRMQFCQSNSADNLERYVAGLLTEQPNKNCDTMASVVPGTHPQRLHHLLTEMVWDETDLNRQRVKQMLMLGSEGEGVLIFDDTGFGKQGRHSVGVARQYSGTFGKVTNCQVTVNCHYAERTLAWPVATRLYLPREWADDPVRRQQAHIPEAIQFQTKAEIALELLDEAKRLAIPHRCVVVDADYGDNPHFLNGLEARGECHAVAVRCDFSVALGRSPKHQVKRADAVLAGPPAREWRTSRWREGSQGQLRAKFLALRLYRVDGGGTRHLGWLIGQRPGRGQTGEWKYFWSNFPAHTPLEIMVEYAHRRYWVEQYHEEAKGELGWDHYQGRRWDGFHRHAVTVMLSYSFLVWLEWQQRQAQRRRGPPRGAFSPKTRPTSAAVAAGASVHH
jgi:SRSO17 transposase